MAKTGETGGTGRTCSWCRPPLPPLMRSSVSRLFRNLRFNRGARYWDICILCQMADSNRLEPDALAERFRTALQSAYGPRTLTAALSILIEPIESARRDQASWEQIAAVLRPALRDMQRAEQLDAATLRGLFGRILRRKHCAAKIWVAPRNMENVAANSPRSPNAPVSQATLELRKSSERNEPSFNGGDGGDPAERIAARFREMRAVR